MAIYQGNILLNGTEDINSILETNKNLIQKFWRGTKQEYNALENLSADTLYIINNKKNSTVIDNDSLLTNEQVMQGTVPYGKELTETWPTLQSRIKEGNFTNICIGDYKTITLTTGEVVVMEVAGIDTYYKTGWPALDHHIDFISRDCLAEIKQFNSTNTNNGTSKEPNPWRASLLFQTMNNETSGVYATLPEELQNCIIEKRALIETRYSNSENLVTSTNWIRCDLGKLWLPTEIEVFGHAELSTPRFGTSGSGCNIQYPIFVGGAKHIIKGNGNLGDRSNWWTMSAVDNNGTAIIGITDTSNSDVALASNKNIRVPLCFRIG